MTLDGNALLKNLICILLITLLSGCLNKSSDQMELADNTMNEGIPAKDDKSIIPESYKKIQNFKEKEYEIVLGISNQRSCIGGGGFNLWVDILSDWKLRNVDKKVSQHIVIYDSAGKTIMDYNDVIILKEIDSYEGFHYRYILENATSDRSTKDVFPALPVKYFLKVKLKIFNKEYSIKPYELHCYGRGIAL